MKNNAVMWIVLGICFIVALIAGRKDAVTILFIGLAVEVIEKFLDLI